MKLKLNLLIATLALFLALPALASAQSGIPPAGSDVKEEPKNAAEGINVKLQIPLPFVKLSAAGEVDNLKDYIEGIYRLLIGVGALFAVVMIIIAGYQYLTSGGSADKTGAAKKRIFNASIGLILALLSYVILNAISSRLVDMELPKVAPVQRIEFDPNATCQTNKQLENKDYVFRITAAGSGLGPGQTAIPTVPRDETKCGQQYEVFASKDPNAAVVGVCPGNKCTEPPGSACMFGKCRNALVAGSISWGPDNGYVDYINVYPVCADKLMNQAGSLDVTEKGRFYKVANDFEGDVPAYEVRDKTCKALGKELKGFVLKVEVNNDCYPGFTEDTDFAIGKDCTQPIHQERVYNFSDLDWSKVSADVLIPLTGIQKKVFTCNLDIQRSFFPVPADKVYETGKPIPSKNCPNQ